MRTLIVLALVVAPTMSHGADWNIPPNSVTCGGSSEVEIYDCVEKAFETADAELNAVWKEVLATIEPDEDLPTDKAQQWKETLIAAQQAWNAFKDQDCNGARSFEYWGGSARSLALVSCLYEYTVARTADLKARYLDPR